MIILKCVFERSKLRIKFHCFINQDNIIYTNVYNNEYNCRFPKNIRAAGAYYKVSDGDISLCRGVRGAHYSIKHSNIKVMMPAEIQNILNPPAPLNLDDIRIFDAGECTICLTAASSIVFLPCAHRCTCPECNEQLKRTRHICPVCRQPVTQEILS
jgi:hypothetical protein